MNNLTHRIAATHSQPDARLRDEYQEYSAHNIIRLLEKCRVHFKCRSINRLCQLLEADPAAISRMRSGRSPITAELLLRIHDATDWSIRDLKAILSGAQ